MSRRKLLALAAFGLAFFSLIIYAAGQPAADSATSPAKAAKLMKDGHWKEAYAAYSKLAMDKDADPMKVGEYLTKAIECQSRLGDIDDIDAFREDVIKAHAGNWRLLATAAKSYMDGQHQGYMVAGKFHRGYARGGQVKYVHAYERDRIRALQLMQQAMDKTGDEQDKAAIGQFYLDFSNMLLANRGWSEAWRLQYLTDLTVLPDYEEGWYYGYGGGNRGAPVDADGKPVYHYMPKSWKDSTTDGERWRWMLSQAMEYAPKRAGEIKFIFASFLHNQFGVQTMAEYGWYFGRPQSDDTQKDESGTWALYTLGDDETIAKLASGIKRFKLPDEFNFIKIFKELADAKSYDFQPREALAHIYENRRQYVKAAEQWQLAIKEFGPGEPGNPAYRQKVLDQIVGNWGQFENIMTQPAGKSTDYADSADKNKEGKSVKSAESADNRGATVDFRFRNATKLSLSAQAIDIAKLLADVKDYINNKPAQLDWEKVEIGNIGARLVDKNQTKYLVGEPEKWDLDLKPRANHVDSRITVQTPLAKAGAYLLTGTLDKGNVSRIVLWIADTAIVKKPLDKATLVYVADAVNGSPVAKANVEFFGYRQEWVDGNRYKITTQDFAEFTDEKGMVILGTTEKAPAPAVPNAAKVQRNVDPNYNWVIIATTEGAGRPGGTGGLSASGDAGGQAARATQPDAPAHKDAGRLAYLGFTGIWASNYYDQEYNQAKVFLITDRPVYRPNNTVKFKFWVNTAKYDLDGKSEYSGKSFFVEIRDPKNEKVLEKTFTADEYGGFDGEITLGKDATLGVYGVSLPADKNKDARGNPLGGGGTFRLEEYKKPEFEVKVDAPDEPVMLGEKITAKVTAKYYFGAPVTEGKAKYKVLRSSYSADWYPLAYWDWFYGPGYWWFACDYPWYPGWNEWGCSRPTPVWWWNWHPREQPEVVAEAEAPLNKDGTFNIEIDTALAKAVHGSTDHKYEITVEVTDQSRRTIVGTGSVLVARKPFKVYAWVDCGHYRTGDVVNASFFAQTLAGKPVKGDGQMTLVKISYDPAKGNAPVEKVVEEWKVPTDAEGKASQQFKAAEPGQYRLVYKVTDAKAHTIEGGYVFTVTGPPGKVVDATGYRFNEIELIQDKKEYKPGDKVDLLINTNQPDSTVLLFVRPAEGVYQVPKLLRLAGKSVAEQIEVAKKDMPNFFIEGLTVSRGQVFTEVREIVVPPENRVLDVKVVASTTRPDAKDPFSRDTEPRSGAGERAADGASLKVKPDEKVKVTIKLTEPNGEPFSGSTVVAMYDKAVEYISGGSNVPAIKEFFWKWQRHHYPQGETSLNKGGYNIPKSGEIGMGFLGVFGATVVEEMEGVDRLANDSRAEAGAARGGFGFTGAIPAPAAPMLATTPVGPAGPMGGANAASAKPEEKGKDGGFDKAGMGGQGGQAGQPGPEPVVRQNFADTAFWAAAVQTDKTGLATVEIKMPENLTTWKTRVWAMGAGTKVGEGSAEVITTKDVIVRLQAPRFFTQKDEVVLSANVHNFLKEKKSIKVSIELEGKTLELIPLENSMDSFTVAIPVQTVDIDANGEKRVDWRVKVVQPGNAIVRMKAVADTDSDAMQMEFPVFIHGMLKMDSYSGVIRPDTGGQAASGTQTGSASVTIKVPAERLPEQSRLEVRYSPTLAGAMVDALPYLNDYPYGCTEQTLNRFLPSVITQKVLLNMGLNLKEIKDKRTNLNAQEIGQDKERAKDWAYRGGYMSRATAEVKNPVFDESELKNMVKAGLEKLTAMQCSDGGWGWFSGWGEHSWPHTTALVVHGLQIARANDVAIVPGVLERGVDWLKSYQAEQVRRLQLPKDAMNHKEKADALDAFVYMVLADEQAAGKKEYANADMKAFLYRDKNDLPVYAKAMFGLALHKLGDAEKRDELIRNCDQFLVQDDEDQTAYLKLPENCWWYWWGSEYEAQAYYLKLISAKVDQLASMPQHRPDPQREAEKKTLLDNASRLVKYLINNRKHASYWNSTRDTAIVVEAFADYIKASGEDKPDMTVKLSIDGQEIKSVKIDASNLFSFDNKLVLEAGAVKTGQHKIELTRAGKGPVYFNAYLTNFTLEDPIKAAGLEVKVNRKFYKLVEADKKVKVAGDRGQVLDQKVEKYDRQELADGATLKSGDLIEIELTIDSKNDYEYVMFEDMKAAGFEPVEVRSGYNGNDLGAYMELRDERVSFFVRDLPRGQRSVSYRLRAEIPGKFSAMPAKASAMYAPELKANSDEMKIGITD